MAKYFPINTASACRLKWSWSTLYLNSGMTASCHRAGESLIDEDFDSFHNTTVKINDRKKMLAGEWPGHGCEYCQEIEQSGGVSDRIFQNQIPDIYPSELDLDASQVRVSPSILEIFFSNTCNFKCVYCNGSLSSSIQVENSKFGGPIRHDETFKGPNRYKEFAPKFWQWFEKNNQTLSRLQILGGEPLLQQDLDRLLEFLDQNPNPDLEFNIVTNLGLPFDIVRKKIDKMADMVKKNKVKRVDVQVSIDGWGPGMEYVRQGLNLDLFEKNFHYLMDSRSFRIGLLSTLCSLTIKEMPALADKFLQWNKLHEIFWYMHLVLPSGSSVFEPTIFDYSLFADDLAKTLESIPQEKWDDVQTRNVLGGIIKKLQVNSEKNQKKQQELIGYLDEIDRRRQLNWRSVFPWLNKEIHSVV